MKKHKLILVGGGGHCKACIDVVECTNEYEIIGILDHADLTGTKVLGHRVIGTDDDILKYKQEGCRFLITVGQIKSAATRIKIAKLLEQQEAILATIISPKAYVSKYAQIGKGTIVMHGVTVNASADVGANCILNTGCGIEHDAIIKDHTHISTHAVVNGGCVVGNEVFLGSNATVSGYIRVGNNIVIGSGSVVLKNIDESGTYAGNPVKKIR
ncbi:MAG: acetyltransferase [Pyrinomonadaceae bacterium]|nr:acetyltransferase [Sphingobacteriaceae bacterium]